MENEHSWADVALVVIYDLAAAVGLCIKLCQFTVPSLLSFPHMTGDSIMVTLVSGDRYKC